MPEGTEREIGGCLEGEHNRYVVAAGWREAGVTLYQVVTPAREVLQARLFFQREDLLHAALLAAALPVDLLPRVVGMDRVGDDWLLLCDWREGISARQLQPGGVRLRALVSDVFWLLSRLEERGWGCPTVEGWDPRWDSDRGRWWFRTLGTCRPLHAGEGVGNWRRGFSRLLGAVAEPMEWKRHYANLWKQEAQGARRNPEGS